MRCISLMRGGVLVVTALLLVGCVSSEERRERTLKFYRETLSGAQQRYEDLKAQAASAVGGMEGVSKTVQEEILELERRIKEAQDAILKIQDGAGELGEGMKNLGEAVGGTAGEVEEAIEEEAEEVVEEAVEEGK